MMSHAVLGVGRALTGCAYAPRKRFTVYVLLLFASAVAVLVFSTITIQLPREEQMEQRIADMQSHIQFLESLYRSRQEDVMILQTKIMAKRENASQVGPGSVINAAYSSPEMQALLKNISGTRAASGIYTKDLHILIRPFIFQLLPHLMAEPNSLRPAYHMRTEMSFVNVVIGIPTVKRDKENYLMITLHHLISGLDEEDRLSTLIVVMVGETDLEYVLNVARQIENKFPKHVETGLIEVIAPPASYYPDFETLPVTLGDSLKRVKWRTKQNLDTLYLMAYAQPKGTFYLMLEDDVIAKKYYMKEIKKFTAVTTVTNPDWFFIEYCQVGGIGKLFKSSNLVHFMTYVQLFYNNLPIDWLLESYLADRVCTIEKTAKTCQKNKLFIRPRYKTSLFQHIGLYSSLKGKIQKIKDSHFGPVPTFYPHKNPAVISIKTTIQEHSDHTLKRAYNGETFFWGLKPKTGDVVEFWFERPTLLNKYMFRSANVEHVSDKFYNTEVEVMPANKSNFTVVGYFDEFGIAESELDLTLGPLSAIRLIVRTDSPYWVILSEIELKPVEDTR